MIRVLAGFCLAAALSQIANAKDLTTNEIVFHDAPAWLTGARLEKIANRIQRTLEWDIRRVQAYQHKDAGEFERSHSLGAGVLAYTRRSDLTVHMGPAVGAADFDEVFGHELGHVIVAQKYKDAVPRWLEEGLANYAAHRGKVDYAWLEAHRPFPPLRSLEHPFRGVSSGPKTSDHTRFHYLASTAAVELIASHCDVTDLLQLAVRRSLEPYLKTLCEFDNLDAAFSAWVKKKAAPARSRNK